MKQLLLALALLSGTAWSQTCTITSDTTPPSVPAGGTHTFTATAGCTFTSTGSGSITSGGVYSAPAKVWAQDVTHGWQLLPSDSVYKMPVNTLPVDSRSAYWLQRIADERACPGPSCLSNYHTFKLVPPGYWGGFRDNIVTNSTPTQIMHFYYPGDSNPWNDSPFPVSLPPDTYTEDGWSQDNSDGADNHFFTLNSQTGEDSEVYNFYTDFRTAVITTGNPTTIAYTTNTIRILPIPLRIYIVGITGGCSILNGSYMASVVSQIPGASGVLSVPVDTTSLNCTSGSPRVSGSAGYCPLCNSAGGQHWFPNSNAITGGTDAAGSPLSATSVHAQEWWNVVQQNILDPACNCVTLGHAIRTTLTNSDISPRNIWPAIVGTGTTGGHPNNPLLSATTGAVTTFTINGTNCNSTSVLVCLTPCPGWTYTVGCTFNIVVGNLNPYTGAWAAANGNWTATAVSNTTFSIPLNSTGFPTLPANGTFIFDWLPYGAHVRLKSSFNVAGYCAPIVLTDKCPYVKAILNTLQVYGLVLLDGTTPSDNWDSGMVTSEFAPDPLNDAVHQFSASSPLANIEQYLEVADVSGLQVNFQPYTDPTNQIGLSNHNRVTVTASKTGYTPSSLDVNLLGTAIGTDREKLSMVAGTTYQINSWITGNANPAVTYRLSPPITGASVSGSGLITAPAVLSAEAKTTVIITSVADITANAYIDLYFIPVSPDGNIRLAFGQHAQSYTDTMSNIWWGQIVNRAFNSNYEISDGIGNAILNGTWQYYSANWISGGTVDPQLYGQSTSAENDTNLTVVVPNATYTATLYGEPGYGIHSAGHNVYDVEAQGTVIASYQDGYILSGSQIYHGYTAPYTVAVSNGLLQFNGRIREHDSAGYGMSWSSLLISPGGACLLAVTTTSPLPGGGIHVPYSFTLGAKCGTPPYTWTLTAGSLPSGLSLSSSGVISGVPTSAGTSTFSIRVTDSASHTANLTNATLQIAGPNPPSLSIGITGLIIPQGVIK